MNQEEAPQESSWSLRHLLANLTTRMALLAILLGLVLIAVTGAPWFPHWGLGPLTAVLVFEELGRAFIIAALLAMTLDQVLRKRAVKEVAGEVARGVEAYYLVYGLPRELADEVLYIKDIRALRRNYSVQLWFHEIPGDTEYITFEVQVSYTFVNFSRKPIESVFRFEQEEASATGERTQILSVSATGPDIPASEQFTERPSGNKFVRSVTVAPNKENPHNTFQWRVRKKMPARYGSDVLTLSEPVVDLRVRVEDKPDTLRVDVELGHRDYERVSKIPAAEPIEWRLEPAAFLPWSPIIIEWRRKEAAPPKG